MKIERLATMLTRVATGLLLALMAVSRVHAVTPKEGCSSIDISGPLYTQGKSTFSPYGGVADVVRSPELPDPVQISRGGFNMYMPATEYPAQDYLGCGVLDVTKPPFNADPSDNPTSASNNTAAFNAALKAGREYMLAVFVPPGSYYIDDKIECIMGYNSDLAEQADRQGACVLFGSSAGASRPKIVLSSTAAGYDNPASPKSMLRFWARGKTSHGGVLVARAQRLYNSGVIGIDFDTNHRPGARAIRMAGAQGSMLADIRIEAVDSHTGILGVPAAGGTVTNIIVEGGMYGIDLLPGGEDITQAPVLAGVHLLGQTVNALRYGGLETMSVVGAEITIPASSTGPAIYANSGGITRAHSILVDSSISFDAANAANVAVETNRGLYLRNVYVENAVNIVSTDDGDTLAGNQSGWRHVREYATSPPGKNRLTNVFYEIPTYIDGVQQTADYADLGGDNELPPSDLISNHLYSESSFPSWETDGAVNIKLPPYNAKGDFVTDDTEAIQRAIDDGVEVIYFPKGAYGVTETIQMAPDTKLVGVARHLAMIVAKDDAGGDFSQGGNPQPVIESADNSAGGAMLANLGIYNPQNVPGSYNLNWRTGRNSVIRNVNNIHEISIGSSGSTSNHPMMIFSGNGGGKVYGQHEMDLVTGQGPGYRIVRIEGTREPLTFYQFNLEGDGTNSYVEAEFNDVENVTTFSFKDEGIQQMYSINNSRRFNIYGTGGFSTCENYAACVEVNNSSDFRIVGSLKRGGNENPPVSAMIKEVTSAGATIVTNINDPVERPILYSRGPLW